MGSIFDSINTIFFITSKNTTQSNESKSQVGNSVQERINEYIN